MKRFIILFLVFIFVLCGCNNQNPNININPDNGYSGYLNSSTDTSTETSTVTSAETTNSSASNTELLNIPEYINKDELANRSYELHFLLGVDKFSSPNELPPNVIVQFAFCHIYYTNLCSMPTTGMKLRETTGNEIEAQISKYFGNISTDITKSDLYNKASQKFKMWEPTYGTKIFYDSTLTKNNEGLYVCTTTFYTNSTKKNIHGKTVLTVEDNGNRAIIKKLSSK
jgi:hypothetical protein